MPTSTYDIDAAIPAPERARHIDLARELAQRIAAGDPPVGALLPTETELCHSTGLSRYAVRQALHKLTGLGLIERQAGVGTRVLASQPPTRYVQAMDGLSDLTRYAEGTSFTATVRERLTADARQAALLRSAPGAKWLHLSGLRTSAGALPEPIALVDIYVADEVSRLSKLPNVGQVFGVPVYQLIEAQYGLRVTRVDQEIQGVCIDGEAAAALRVEPGTPGLRIIRTYLQGERAIEVTTGLHPASRFSYTMSFRQSA